ncbi:MAG TPA: ROK family protein [Phycisphaerae bacterium]|nr:ROK family protein [Phycisphaerae bacterium]
MPLPAVLTILRTIKDRASISRTDLQQLTGLSWGTVTNTTRDLLARRLIREEGATATKAGRKPVRLALNRLTHAIIGLHLAPDHLRLVALNITGETLAAESLPFDGSSPHDLLRLVAERLKAIRATEALAGRTLLGLGAALPGALDPADGVLITAPNLPAWKQIPVRSVLHAATGLPVRIERLANCLALAERWFGNDRPEQDADAHAGGALGTSGEENLLCLHLDHDIDLGVILAGKVFHGSSALAGDIAHLPLLPHAASCPACHQRGCLTSLASQEDPTALGDGVELLTRMLVALFDPDALILTGRLPARHPVLHECAAKGVRAARLLGHNAQLLAPAVRLDAPAIGACGLVLDAAFDAVALPNSAVLTA